MISLLKHHYEPPTNFHIPAIWLFSPDGKMVAQATDEPSLTKLTNEFSSHATTSTLPATPDFTVLNGVLTELAGVKANSPQVPDSKQWTTVLFTSNSADCHHCAAFANAFNKMRNDRRGRLHTIHVLLTD